MKTLFENEYQTIYLYEDLNAFEQRFKKESKNILLAEDYIKELHHFGMMIQKHQRSDKTIQNLIINIIDGGPAMTSKAQKWMHEEFYPFLEKEGITTKVYCLGGDNVAKLSIQITAWDNPKDQFEYKFFDTLENGISWLKSQV